MPQEPRFSGAFSVVGYEEGCVWGRVKRLTSSAPSCATLCQAHRDSFASVISRRIRMLVPATRVMNVVTAVTTARRRSNDDDHHEHRDPGKEPSGHRHRDESARKAPSCETGA